jgi:hypothetical protein
MCPSVKEGAIRLGCVRLGLLCVDLVNCRLLFLVCDPKASGNAEGLEWWAQDGCDLVGRGDLLVVDVHEDAAWDLKSMLVVVDVSVWSTRGPRNDFTFASVVRTVANFRGSGRSSSVREPQLIGCDARRGTFGSSDAFESDVESNWIRIGPARQDPGASCGASP